MAELLFNAANICAAPHGYTICAGTLYRLLHRLEQKAYLRSTRERSGKSSGKICRATPLGRKALRAAKSKIRELFGELTEGHQGGMMRRGLPMKWACLLFLLSMLFGALTTWAGPPFQTDDPEPIDYRNFEFYTFGTADGTAAEMDTSGPAAEFNWGALPNVHLHILVPLAAIFPSNNPALAPAGEGSRAVGLGDIETGVKFRFIQEGKHRPQVGTFVMFELPVGSAAKGLGVGKTWYKVPLWAQKSFGPWTTYGGGGETVFSNSPGYKNYPFAGWLLQRDIGKKLTLGTEVFYHGAEGLGTAQTRSAALVDIGGYYYFRNPGFQLLFAYGHTAVGQSENYAYLGLYWTWGKKSDKDKDADTAQMP